MPSESFPLSGFYSLVYLESETTISKQDFLETIFFLLFSWISPFKDKVLWKRRVELVDLALAWQE